MGGAYRRPSISHPCILMNGKTGLVLIGHGCSLLVAELHLLTVSTCLAVINCFKVQCGGIRVWGRSFNNPDNHLVLPVIAQRHHHIHPQRKMLTLMLIMDVTKWDLTPSFSHIFDAFEAFFGGRGTFACVLFEKAGFLLRSSCWSSILMQSSGGVYHVKS